jgi:predicted acyl esterase
MKLLWDSQIAVNQNGNGNSPYRDRFTGERSTGDVIDPLVLQGSLSNLYETGLQHPFDDAWYRQRTPLPERIVVPMLSAGNWGGLGLHLRGNVIGFEQVASKQKWLEIHDDTHFASMYLADAVALQMRFFDHFLKGEQNGFDKEPPVLLTIRDPRGFKRRKENEWPLARTEWVKYALDASGMSIEEKPVGAPGKAQYDAMGASVIFRSAPFAQDTEFTGPVAAKLFVSSSTTDMDLFLTLRAFDTSGNEVTFKGANDPQAPVTQGWLRVSQRKLDPARSKSYRPFHPHDGQEKLQPDTIYEVDVEIWPTSIVFPEGYTMALTVGGKDFEREGATGMMKGSGIFMHDSTADRPAPEFAGVNTIFTGGKHASYLLLPRIPDR